MGPPRGLLAKPFLILNNNKSLITRYYTKSRVAIKLFFLLYYIQTQCILNSVNRLKLKISNLKCANFQKIPTELHHTYNRMCINKMLPQCGVVGAAVVVDAKAAAGRN